MKIHFIGIGGIGLSALARFLKEQKHEISGSDIAPSKITQELIKENININIPHNELAIKDKELIIYSAAINPNNIELKKAKELDLPCLSRKEALPMILKNKQVLAVAGAHGKSTTSSILSYLLNDASVIIGALLKEYNSNMIYKKNNKIIFEADESDKSFLNSNPYLAIITNTEADHLENYNNDIKLLQKAYKDFINLAKIKIINAEDPFLGSLKDINALRLYPSKDIKNIKTIIKDYKPITSFDFKDYGNFIINGIGEHLAIDAALALIAAKEFKDIKELKEPLSLYKGIKKRFDILLALKSHAIIDDYGHHPTEIFFTLKAARTYATLAGYSKITAIFQPHKYTRLINNINNFQKVFKDIDELVILPIYAAGEDPIKINMKKYFPKATFIDDIKRVGNDLIANNGQIYNQGLIIGFGAGDITTKLRS